MENTFVLFSDIIGEELANRCAGLVSKFYPDATFILQNSKGSLFNSTKTLVNSKINTRWTVLITNDVTNWSIENWTRFLFQAQNHNSAIEQFEHESIDLANGQSVMPSISCFETSDLQMALDQNYRPNFENIYEAYETFGFKPNFVSILSD